MIVSIKFKPNTLLNSHTPVTGTWTVKWTNRTAIRLLMEKTPIWRIRSPLGLIQPNQSSETMPTTRMAKIQRPNTPSPETNPAEHTRYVPPLLLERM